LQKALDAMPDETVIDGELVAVDSAGRPSSNVLQSYDAAPLMHYVVDVMSLAGNDVANEPLSERRQLLQERVYGQVG
jgi:ATP-dependent DNA ligase